jgi:LysR family transcriptional regulator, transcriptional activator of nhaA
VQLNFLHLYHFYVIAKQGQIARAAKALRIGQPTLSTQLKSLEEVLGFRLFERKRGEALRMTEKGKTIFHYAEQMFRIGEEMVEVSKGLNTSRPVQFRIGALDTIPKQLVFKVMKHALELSGGGVSVFEDNADRLFEKLFQHKYDLVISTAPAPQSERFPIKAKRLSYYPVIVCGAGRFKGLRKGFPDSLRGQPVILPTPDGRMRPDIEEYLRDRRVEVNVIGEAQDAEVLRMAALSGMALVPLSHLTVEEDIRLGRLHVIGELEGLREELWVSSFPRVVRDPISSKFMKLSHL